MSTAQILVASPLEAPAMLAATGPIRELLLTAITLAVDGVYGVPTPESEREAPVTIVQDSTDVATNNYDVTSCTMPVAVARVELASSTLRSEMRTQANAALATLIKNMQADETFGELADGCDYVGGGIVVELGRLIFAEASFNVRYHHVRGDPYTKDPP